MNPLLFITVFASAVAVAPAPAVTTVTAASPALAFAPAGAVAPAAARTTVTAASPAIGFVPAAAVAPAGALTTVAATSPAIAAGFVVAPAPALTTVTAAAPAIGVSFAVAPAAALTLVAATSPELSTLPVSLDQLRAHVHVEDNGDDAALRGYLAAAIGHVEARLGRPVTPRSVRTTFDRWPCGGGTGWGGGSGWGSWPLSGAGSWPGGWGASAAGLTLPLPVLSVDAVAYTDASGAQVAWPAGQWIARTSPGGMTRVRPATGQAWPALGPDPQITVDATAGYGIVPPAVAQAILLLAGHFYLNREEVLTGARITALQLPLGVAELLAPHRWQWLA